MNKFIFPVLLSIVIILGFSVSAFASYDPIVKETPEDPVLSNEDITVLRVTSTDTNGFHAVMLGLIGDYNPIVKDYTYQTYNGSIQHSISIQPDWSWIASCATFVVVFFCFMLFLGKLFSR